MPSRWAEEWGIVSCLWLREMLRLKRERMRWAGAVAQPLLFWLIIGSGMAESFTVGGSAPGEGVGALQYFYPGILVMIVLFTTMGGMEVEEAAEKAPESMRRCPVDIRDDFPAAQARAMIEDLLPEALFQRTRSITEPLEHASSCSIRLNCYLTSTFDIQNSIFDIRLLTRTPNSPNPEP